MNKNIIFLILLLIFSCSPKGLILTKRVNNEIKPIRIAVLDFYNHTETSNRKLGRELNERTSYAIFAYSQGSIEVIERNYIKSTLETMGLELCKTYSKAEVMALAESLEADFIIKGTIIEHQTDIMEDIENIIDAIISVIHAKDGSTVAMLKLRKKGLYHQHVIEHFSTEAGRAIVQRRNELYELLYPAPADTSNAQ